MKIRTAIIISTVSALIIPNFLYAATLGLGSLVELANTLASGVVTSLGYLFFALAVVAFLWGMVQFIWNARNGDSGKGMENGKQFMLWGLIALFVMFSVWGIITFAQKVFNINGQTSIVIPNIQLLGSGSSANSNAGPASPAPTSECPNGPNLPCTTTGQDGKNLTGTCNQLNQCVPTTPSTKTSAACPNGPNKDCTDVGQDGKPFSGTCNGLSQCVPKTSTVTTSTTCPNDPNTGKPGTFSSKYGCIPSGLCLKTDAAGKTTFATGVAGVEGVCK